MSDNDLLALADRIGGIVAAGVSDSDRERIEAELRSGALAAVAALDPNTIGSPRLRAVKILRDGIRNTTGRAPMLRPLVDAVDWAMAQPRIDLDSCRVRNSLGFGWSYRFPNGHEATVVNDPSRPFRFEVCSAALNVGGDTVGGLTSEQVEAKLHAIAALPTR